MTGRLTKKQLMDALLSEGVEVRSSFTLAQLQAMYDKLGAGFVEADDDEKHSETTKNAEKVSEATKSAKQTAETINSA